MQNGVESWKISAEGAREKLKVMVQEVSPNAQEMQNDYIVRIRSKMQEKYKSKISSYSRGWFGKIVADAYDKWIEKRKVI